jgi:manganese oxidase
MFLIFHRFVLSLRLAAAATMLVVPVSGFAETMEQGQDVVPVGAQTAAHPGGHAAMSHQTPSWFEQLKGQTVIEDTISGRPERAAMVEVQHDRIMSQMQNDLSANMTDGLFNNMSMMHQYMGQDGSSWLLAVDSEARLSNPPGAKCPAGVPAKRFDVSMIDAEITLNRWLDYYPGYMYVLTENIEKVREEEAKNAAAREKDDFDAGAVTTGIQGDYIQPLVLRANQGDCLRITPPRRRSSSRRCARR